MRFLFFAAQYLPTTGGVERYTYNLCRTLAEMGHSCVIVTSALPSLPERESDGAVEVVRLPSRLFIGGRFPVIKRNSRFRSVIAEIFGGAYDIAVINTRFYPLSLFAARHCAKRDIPAIVIEHGTKHLSMDNPVLDFFGNIYEHSAMRYIRRFCERFFGVSKACCDWLSHFGVKPEGVLYNMVDPDEIMAAAEGSGYHPKEIFGISKTAPLIVFSSRLIREKGVFELLGAFEACRGKYPDAALIMSGDGPLFDTVREKKPENVFLVGRLEYADNLALIKQADIFALPTYSEGFSSVILEAAALGKCVVTTPTGGSRELITGRVSGILIDEVSPGSIENALIYCLSNDGFRADAGEKIRLKVSESFTRKKTASDLVGIVQNSIGVREG